MVETRNLKRKREEEEARPRLPTRQSLRLNPHLGPSVLDFARPIEKEEIMKKVLRKLGPIEQVRLRKVSLYWNDYVIQVCKEARSLVLHLPNYNEKKSYMEHCFELNVDGNFAPLNIANKVVLTLKRGQWTYWGAHYIGKLYPNIEHLTIYNHHSHHDELNKLFQVIRKCRKVVSLSLIMSAKNPSNYFVRNFFAIINGQFENPLTTMHLYFENSLDHIGFRSRFDPQPLPALNTVEPSKALSQLQDFSIHCPIENLSQLIERMGIASTGPLRSLSLPAQMAANQIAPMFVNNQGLVQIKRFQLTKIHNIEVVERFLEGFVNLEFLQLWGHDFAEMVFSVQLHTAVARLGHLEELELYQIQPVTLQMNRRSNSKVRRLKVSQKGFFGHMMQDWETRSNKNVLWYVQYVNSLAFQFPMLEMFTIVTDERNQENEDAFREYCIANIGSLTEVTFLNNQ